MKTDALKNKIENKSYQRTFSLQATENKIYDSILNIPLWWTEMYEGNQREAGEKFTVCFEPSVFKTMVVEELIPNKKIVWKVVDSLIDIPDLNNKTEWINTQIVWEISAIEKNTTLTLTHIGLTPKIECYTICESGWNSFTKSLIDLILKDVGTPFRPIS